MKKAIALALSLALSLGMLAGCGGGGGGKEPEYSGPSYDQLKVGEDYTDLSAELRVITQRTDLADNVFTEYVKEFNKLYPNIKISYESITNYQDDMTARLSSSNFSFDQGGVPIVKGSPYPESLSEFEGIELIEDTPAPTELADLQPNVNRESEVGVNTDNTHVQRIVEGVVTVSEALDDIIADWNSRWNAAVDRYAPAQ